MTENEAIEKLKIFPEWNKVDEWLSGAAMEELVNTCNNALEEIQKYRELGKVEFLTDMKSNYVETLSDLRQYQKLGTVEELKEDKAIAEETAISGKWIPCGERLPETGRNVLVCCGFLNERYIAIAELCEYKGKKSWSIKSSVYAWQQLPEPYQEKKGVNHE